MRHVVCVCESVCVCVCVCVCVLCVTDLVNLKYGDERCLQIVGLGLFGVVDLNGMLSALQIQNRRFVEVLREQIHVHGGRHHKNLQINSIHSQKTLLYRLQMINYTHIQIQTNQSKACKCYIDVITVTFLNAEHSIKDFNATFL